MQWDYFVSFLETIKDSFHVQEYQKERHLQHLSFAIPEHWFEKIFIQHQFPANQWFLNDDKQSELYRVDLEFFLQIETIRNWKNLVFLCFQFHLISSCLICLLLIWYDVAIITSYCHPILYGASSTQTSVLLSKFILNSFHFITAKIFPFAFVTTNLRFYQNGASKHQSGISWIKTGTTWPKVTWN